MITDYEIYYAEKHEEGLEYQDFVREQLQMNGISVIFYGSKKQQFSYGENKAGIEIKHDKKLARSGNLYIEIAEKSRPTNPVYVSSGIYRSDNSWLYVIGNYSIIFVFSKKALISAESKFHHVTTPTSKGFLIPQEEAMQMALKVIKIQ